MIRVFTVFPIPVRFAALFAVALLASGCAASQHTAQTTTADAATPDAATTDATTGTATGHLHLTGGYAFDRNFTVNGCAVGPPGTGLLSGYHMTAADSDPSIELLSVTVKDYAHDGSYSPADKTTEGQVASAMSSGVTAPLQIMISQGEGQTPLTIMLKPESTMTIAISEGGSKGDVQFANMETPLTMADMQASGSGTPHGKRISGSVTWSCGKVDRINGKMNDTVNGMFKKLIPPK